ncbi:Zinc finger BED domain-containing protein RICESLEEPER 2 [Rhynchospora pubera]|uniref:Zinc finger BED domain-containing protein RICESLEEPER 2 n=2 Tax=Rhynchospora pubera TaxID=906938 RepID=A0AAV8CKV7_9POAL|nr:Zinc finger BED domain-containing protein RICESLEEPER 2 [Rhynchospora pubera]
MELTSDAEIPNEEATPPPRRRGRKKSQVWDHFTIENVSGGCTRACCKLCKQTFAYSSGSKIAGTSHLKRHITQASCPMIKNEKRSRLALTAGNESEQDGGSSEVPQLKRRYRVSGYPNALFDPERSLNCLAKMIILHDYPLHIVEQPAFVAFVESLNPRFKVLDVGSMEGEILAIYQREKENLVQTFANIPGRISLAIGLWTTSQTLGYISLAGQFIDSDWKLHRRMLNFMMVSSPHSENALSEAISLSLSDWNMKDRLFTITLDNDCSSHDIYSANLRDHLSNKHTLMLRGQLFVVRCYAHILNVVAQDVIASIHGTVYNIRESIKFVKASPSREEKFAEISLQLEIPSTKTLSLDMTTQWNTTYTMLEAALEYKQAFTVLETCDDNYNEAPSAEDWRKVEVVCAYLKLLYDSANVIAGTAEPTSNVFYHEAWKIQHELVNAITSEDPMISNVAKDMHEKFDKYWKDCNLVLAIAVVMDPRFKLKLVEFSFSKIYGEDSSRYLKAVSDGIHELYQEYAAQPLPLTPAYVEQAEEANHAGAVATNPPSNETEKSKKNATAAPVGNAGDRLLDFDMYLSEIAVTQPARPEIEQYLEEALVPRHPEFEILNWWKVNSVRYPTLSKMARDVLGIPMFMAAGPGGGSASSVFCVGTGNRVLDEYRSSLRPELVEALFCAKDWLQYQPIVDAPATSPAIVKTEM